jgi:hypothetical protein
VRKFQIHGMNIHDGGEVATWSRLPSLLGSYITAP